MGNNKLFHYLVIIAIANSASARDFFDRKKIPLTDDIFDLDEQNDYPVRQHQVVEANYKGFPRKQDIDAENSRVPKFPYKRYLDQNNIKCEIEVTKVKFDDSVFEFWPSQYYNKSCTNSTRDEWTNEEPNKPEICRHDNHDEQCKTQVDEMIVWKRNRYNPKNCWTLTTLVIGTGCKCNIRFTYNNEYN